MNDNEGGGEEQEEEEHWAAAPLQNMRESVRRLFTRSRPVERDEEADENTPLVRTPSTPRRSDRVV